jgi:exosome complex RNA-binding protein Rrp42 (RNase PH superfamily)
MSASMASLKAELNNARTELAATREDHGLALAEKEQRCELELNQMRAQWEVAVISEATLTDANFALNESLLKVTGLLKLIVAAVALYMYFH